MGAWNAFQNVSAIFDQKKIVLIAECAKPHDVTGKSKVVDRQDSSDVTVDFRLEIRPIRRAIPAGRIETQFGAEMLDWFNSRRAKIRRNQNLLSGLDPQSAQSVKESV